MNELLEKILNIIPALVSYWDTEYVCRFVNDPYVERFNLPKHEIIGRTLKELVGEVGFEARQRYFTAAFAGVEQNYDLHYTKGVTLKDREKLVCSLIPHSEDGKIVGVIAFVLTASSTEGNSDHGEILSRLSYLTKKISDELGTTGSSDPSNLVG
jgi:PAS domain-containing protein